MVNDPSSSDLIRWSDDGKTFLVQRQEDFAKDVLPRFFKHNNFASFVRQLNMYGFHKVPHLQQGVLHADGEEQWEFSNDNFQRDQPDLLCLVTRKKGRADDDKDINSVDIGLALREIAALKTHQLTISSDLNSLRRENQLLWQEIITAREQHNRHQEVLARIFRFIASMVCYTDKSFLPKKRRRLLLGQGDTNSGEKSVPTDFPDLAELQALLSGSKKETFAFPPETSLPDWGLDNTDFSAFLAPELHDTPSSSSSTPEPAVKSTSPTADRADSITLQTERLGGEAPASNMSLGPQQTSHALVRADYPIMFPSPELPIPPSAPSDAPAPTSSTNACTNVVPMAALSDTSMRQLKSVEAIQSDIHTLQTDIAKLTSQLGISPDTLDLLDLSGYTANIPMLDDLNDEDSLVALMGQTPWGGLPASGVGQFLDPSLMQADFLSEGKNAISAD